MHVRPINASTDKISFQILHFLVLMYCMVVLHYAKDVFETVVVYFLCIQKRYISSDNHSEIMFYGDVTAVP